jgi:hypothetical protein
MEIIFKQGWRARRSIPIFYLPSLLKLTFGLLVSARRLTASFYFLF